MRTRLIVLGCCLIAGCAAPHGYHYAGQGKIGSPFGTLLPNNPCGSTYLKSKAAVETANSTLGRPGASVPKRVARIVPLSNPGKQSSSDKHEFNCSVKLDYKDGSSDDGTLTFFENERVLYGGLSVAWEPDNSKMPTESQTSSTQSVTTSNVMRYSALFQLCNLRWEIAVSAEPYRNGGWPEQSADSQLISEYVYGGNHEIYGSPDYLQGLVVYIVHKVYSLTTYQQLPKSWDISRCPDEARNAHSPQDLLGYPPTHQ